MTHWIRDNAAPLATLDPAAPLDDLAPLGRPVGDAELVGLGESVHGAAEEVALKHRTLRFLVERKGFRSVAWEEDWTTGLQIDRFLYNAGHADKVRFVGVEYYLLGALAYDAVERYVARTAPRRLAELRRHLRVIRPSTSDMFAYIGWFLGVADKGPCLRHAHRVYRVVKGVPHRPGDRAQALALHHARQIVSFYEHYSLPQPPASDSLVYRDAHAAGNLRHGTVSLGPGQTVAVPPPAPGWFERPLGQVGLDRFTLDLRQPAPPTVGSWLHAPIRTRGLPDRGPGSFMAGGSLAQWYDLLVHRQALTPAAPYRRGLPCRSPSCSIRA